MTKKLLYLALFLPCVLFAEGNNPSVVIGPFSGLNNEDNPTVISSEQAQDLLNVDLSLGGRSVKKRKGFGLAYALTKTTSPVHGTYIFYDSNGNDVALSFNDVYITASISGGSPSVLSSTGPNGATYQCVDSQGFAYCANTTRNSVIKTNGQSISNLLTLVSTGTMVAVTPDRLVLSGFLSTPNRVDFSAAADFTSWTTGVSPTSAFNFTITSPGSHITHITYAFNRIIWFKDYSFGYILPGATASDWVVKTISPNIGTLDNTSVYDKGILYFRSQEGHIYAYDGSNLMKLSRDIGGTIGVSGNRTSNSWTQTTQADFQAGISTPTAYLSFTSVSGSVVIDTTTAVTTQTDTTGADFISGTLTNTSTITVPNSVVLSFRPMYINDSFYPGADDATCSSPCSSPYYQMIKIAGANISDSILSSVTLRLKKTGSPGTHRVQLFADSGGSPGAVLETVNLDPTSVPTSISAVTVNFSSTTRLVAGTTYWLGLNTSQTCDGSNKIEWYGTGFAPSNSSSKCGSSSSAGIAYAYRIYSASYTSSGNIVSRTFDVGQTTNTILWNWCEFIPNGSLNGQTLSYETQTSSSATGTFTSLVSVSSRASPSSTVQRFIRYKATFGSSVGGLSPQLDDVTMQACFVPSFYSQVKNAPSLASWDSFTATKIDNGGTQSFYIRSSTNPIAVQSSTPAWTAISVGAVPSISTGTYFQIRDDFSITNTTQSPTLQEFTQSWFEGSAADKAYATYFKDAVWWAVTSGTGATTNNYILRYDLTNSEIPSKNVWTLYDIGSNGFYTRNNSLYFGSSSTGNIFKFGDSENDNGSAINAFWKSKDFFNSSPFVVEDMTDLSLFFSAVANSSMTITYAVNGSSSTSYTVPTGRSSSSFGINNRNLPLGTSGNTFSVKFGNNAANQPFEVFAVQYGNVPKPWKPGSQ